MKCFRSMEVVLTLFFFFPHFAELHTQQSFHILMIYQHILIGLQHKTSGALDLTLSYGIIHLKVFQVNIKQSKTQRVVRPRWKRRCEKVWCFSQCLTAQLKRNMLTPSSSSLISQANSTVMRAEPGFHCVFTFISQHLEMCWRGLLKGESVC